MRWFAVSGYLFLAVIAPLRAEGSCWRDKLQQMPARVKMVQEQLLTVKVGGMDTSVLPATQERIRALKDALAATVDAYMQCERESAVDVKKFESTLAGMLGANKPEPTTQITSQSISEVVDQVYGARLQLVVGRPESEPQSIGVEVSFGLNCGVDTMLLVYERQNEKWRQVLRWQSGDYNEISGAFGDFFEYVVIPHGALGRWVIAVAHGKPWCTSRWSGFDVDVIRPAHGSVPQHVLFHNHAGYVRDSEPVLKAESDGFELRLEKGSLDIDVMTRTGIYRYRLVGDKVHRVQPVAKNARDFVDEWLQAEWSEATDWTATEIAGSLKEEHTRIAGLRDPKAKNWPSFRYGATRGCLGDPKRFQVELDQDRGAPTFFEIREGRDSFTMLSASSQPDPQCKGADLMQKP